LHNEINKKYPLPNNQACNFLQAAVSGMPNLASIYQTWNINNQSNAEPSDRELQFLEYVQLLILNAQVYDAGRKNCSKSSKLDVNLTDLAFKKSKQMKWSMRSMSMILIPLWPARGQCQ
jgi:hypothetical protein